jgi:hypothetical protein
VVVVTALPLDRSFLVSAHARERYAEFYPTADLAEILREVNAGTVLELPAALALMQGGGAGWESSTSAYVLHRERSGIFVISEAGTVVTFLRFYARWQHTAAVRDYPGGGPPTCDTAWAREIQRAEEERATREQRNRERAAEHRRLRRLERQERGLKQAAALLRRHRWICIPPEGEEP